MDNAGYVSITRQDGLLRKLDTVANNLANLNTTGYRREEVTFSEHVKALAYHDPSLSMTQMNHSIVDMTPGEIKPTGNELDFAINGEGFFLVEAPGGERLTRAGAFTVSPEGELSTPEGFRVLSPEGAAIAIPAQASELTVTPEGAIFADGQAIGRIAVVNAPLTTLKREGENVFSFAGDYEPVENPKVVQKAIEGSNVNAVMEVAELIDVQRAYEMSQKLVKDEDDRIRQTVRQVGQRPS